MKFYNYIYFIPALVASIFLNGCSSKAESIEKEHPVEATNEVPTAGTAPKTITHFNVIITPDLSNRLLSPKPVSDDQIVNSVLRNIYPTILKYGKTVNQQDIFSTSIVSNKHINQFNVKTQDLQIDFSRFGNKQLNRIEYITGKATDNNFEMDKKKFLQEYKRVSAAAAQSTSGADIWTYFNTGIGNTMVRDKGPESVYHKVTYPSQYRNIMILLTDGYIEAGMFGKKACSSSNQCYYLSGQKIKDFRTAFKKSGMNDMKAFFEQNNYGIVPAQNSNLHNLEVLVLQMEDRSLDKAGNATVYPTDMEIMQLFWTDWLTKSKVKRFELRPVLASETEVDKVVLGFMGVK